MRLKTRANRWTLLGKGLWRGHADMLTGMAAQQEPGHLPPPAAEHHFQPSNFPLALFLAEAAQKPGDKEPHSLQSSASHSI